MKFRRSQLLIYAVTDRAWSEDTGLVSQVEEALKGGATMIQLREKELDGKQMELFYREAMEIRQLTQRYKVPLIIDDNLELALK